MDTKTVRRNGLIDIERFIFAILIVLFHSKYYREAILPSGYIAVEFFFVLSGYLLANKAENYNGNDIWNDNIRFVLRKILRIFPFLLLSVIWGSLWYAYLFSSISSFKEYLIFSYVDYFSLQMFGFDGVFVSGVSWYLSVLFLCTFLFFPVLIKHRDAFIKYIAPVIVLFFYGLISHKNGSLNCPNKWYAIVDAGLLRGIAGITLGTIIYEVRKYIDSRPERKLEKICLPLVTVVVIALTVLFALSGDKYNTVDFLFAFILSMLVAVSFSQKNVLVPVLTGKFSSFLGKFSLSIFLCHYYISALMPALAEFDSNLSTIVYFAGVAVSATFNYIIGNLIVNRKTRYATIIAVVMLIATVLIFL